MPGGLHPDLLYPLSFQPRQGGVNILLILTGRSSGSRMSLLAGLPGVFLQWLSQLSSPVTAAVPLPIRHFSPTGFPISPHGALRLSFIILEWNFCQLGIGLPCFISSEQAPLYFALIIAKYKCFCYISSYDASRRICFSCWRRELGNYPCCHACRQRLRCSALGARGKNC